MNVDLTAKELEEAITPNLNMVAGVASVEVGNKMQELAAASLKSGLEHWQKGFKVDKVSDDLYILSLEGKLANMMEDGFSGKEFVNMIMNGNRAKTNKAAGKPYVDVPMPMFQGGGIVEDKYDGTGSVHINQFRSGADVIKSVTTSDWKKGGTKNVNKLQQRVKDIIRNRESQQKDAKLSFVTIRRVTANSEWKSWRGAHVFTMAELDSYTDTAFQVALEKLI